MKKLLLSSLSLLVLLNAQAQLKNKLRVEAGGGYELNTFLAPAEIDGESEAVNASFQVVNVRNSLTYKRKKHRFKLYTKGAYSVFQTEEPSNSYALKIKAAYRVKYAKSKYFEFAPEFTKVDRGGLENVNEVLITLFSYERVKVPVSFDFYLGNRIWLKTDAGFIYKNYGKLNGEKLSYQDPYAQLKLSKRFVGEKTVKKLSYRTAFHRRRYATLSNPGDIAEFDELSFEGDEFRAGTLNWNFLFNTISFTVEDSTKKQSLAVGLHHISRLDQRNQSTYHEFGPSVALTKRKNRFQYELRTRYTFRNYPRFDPNGDELYLKYTYLKLNATVFYDLKKNTRLYVRGDLFRRTSNNTNRASMSFRDFNRPSVQLGVRIDL